MHADRHDSQVGVMARPGVSVLLRSQGIGVCAERELILALFGSCGPTMSSQRVPQSLEQLTIGKFAV